MEGHIFENKNLQILSMNNIGLKELSPKIGDLSNLSTLYVSNNKLTTLPESIKNLQKLQTLVLENNNFDCEEIKRIRSLVNVPIRYESCN